MIEKAVKVACLIFVFSLLILILNDVLINGAKL
jgi:hypothetical protein